MARQSALERRVLWASAQRATVNGLRPHFESPIRREPNVDGAVHGRLLGRSKLMRSLYRLYMTGIARPSLTNGWRQAAFSEPGYPICLLPHPRPSLDRAFCQARYSSCGYFFPKSFWPGGVKSGWIASVPLTNIEGERDAELLHEKDIPHLWSSPRTDFPGRF